MGFGVLPGRMAECTGCHNGERVEIPSHGQCMSESR